ncbi:MAG: tetratricopeptide repeat protein [Alphaproteobacteria bacterium]|nr:tetratricopeptide repeat protein [Alphaproteobacteria bacterium]MDA8004047.1 tetratricopeptide repeat protein [Alphaproteobacteria bacterium]MDA8005577.1 tetratricopeptide repeat protein [Alphaproteobacteria bacterium]MDA8012578.1 tetratricopeptide repeat protein [Alphaproteobacteria bacterium]
MPENNDNGDKKSRSNNLVDLAQGAVERGNFDDAIGVCSDAIKMDPENADAFRTRGLAYERKGEYDRAIEDLNKAIELNPDHARAYKNRGNTYSDKGEYDLAIADFNKAIELNPDYAKAYNNRGNAYHGKKEYDRTIADYSKAIELDPGFARAYYNRGNTYDKKGEYDLAIADFSKAIELKHDYANAYNNRGNIYGKKGEHDLAIQDYDEAIDLNPGHTAAHHNRALSIEQKSAQRIAEEYKRRSDEQLKEALDKREQDLRELLSRYEAPEKVVKRFLDREEKYTSLVDALDKEVKEFSASLPVRLCKQAGFPVVALSLLLLALSFALRAESSYLWILLPLLPLTLAVLSYPSISHLRHLREKRNRLEVCREDYFRKGTMAEYIIFAGISDDSKKHQAIAVFLSHLGDRSAAEFLSEWKKPVKDDGKVLLKNILEATPLEQSKKDDSP